MMTISVMKVDIDVPRHLSRVRSDELWTFAATEWYHLYEQYTPYRTGRLYNTVTITPGQIEHTVPYSRIVYEGDFNFRRDKHILACRHWDKAAEPTQKPKLVQAMQSYIDRMGV